MRSCKVRDLVCMLHVGTGMQITSMNAACDSCAWANAFACLMQLPTEHLASIESGLVQLLQEAAWEKKLGGLLGAKVTLIDATGSAIPCTSAMASADI